MFLRINDVLLNMDSIHAITLTETRGSIHSTGGLFHFEDESLAALKLYLDVSEGGSDKNKFLVINLDKLYRRASAAVAKEQESTVEAQSANLPSAIVSGMPNARVPSLVAPPQKVRAPLPPIQYLKFTEG